MPQTMEVLTESATAYASAVDLIPAIGDESLRQLIARGAEELRRRDECRKKTALSEAKRLLKAAGISAKIGKKKERK